MPGRLRLAPVVTVNYEFYDQQTTGNPPISCCWTCAAGKNPAPTRGAPLLHVQADRRQLAGFFDQDAETAKAAVEADSTGEPTLVGVRIAADRGETAPSYDPARSHSGTRQESPDDATHPRTHQAVALADFVDAQDLRAARGLSGAAQGFRTDLMT